MTVHKVLGLLSHFSCTAVSVITHGNLLISHTRWYHSFSFYIVFISFANKFLDTKMFPSFTEKGRQSAPQGPIDFKTARVPLPRLRRKRHWGKKKAADPLETDAATLSTTWQHACQASRTRRQPCRPREVGWTVQEKDGKKVIRPWQRVTFHDTDIKTFLGNVRAT